MDGKLCTILKISRHSFQFETRQYRADLRDWREGAEGELQHVLEFRGPRGVAAQRPQRLHLRDSTE